MFFSKLPAVFACLLIGIGAFAQTGARVCTGKGAVLCISDTICTNSGIKQKNYCGVITAIGEEKVIVKELQTNEERLADTRFLDLKSTGNGNPSADNFAKTRVFLTSIDSGGTLTAKGIPYYDIRIYFSGLPKQYSSNDQTAEIYFAGKENSYANSKRGLMSDTLRKIVESRQPIYLQMVPHPYPNWNTQMVVSLTTSDGVTYRFDQFFDER